MGYVRFTGTYVEPGCALCEPTAISLKINSSNAVVNGQSTTLDVPAMIIDGRTMVPARFIAESFGADVKWDASTRSIIIIIN